MSNALFFFKIIATLETVFYLQFRRIKKWGHIQTASHLQVNIYLKWLTLIYFKMLIYWDAKVREREREKETTEREKDLPSIGSLSWHPHWPKLGRGQNQDQRAPSVLPHGRKEGALWGIFSFFPRSISRDPHGKHSSWHQVEAGTTCYSLMWQL